MMILFLGFSCFCFLCAGSFGTNHSCGVVVLYRSVLECRSVVCEFDGRFVLVEFSLHGSVFSVASIYAPNRNPDDNAFWFIVLILLILLFLLFCAAVSTVLDRGIATALVLLKSLRKVLLCCWLCFWIAVLWIFGVKGTQLTLPLPGSGPVGPLQRALTSSVVCMLGCLMCLL